MPQSVVIDRRLAGRTLLDVLHGSLRLSRKKALESLRERRVRISGGVCTDPARQVALGQHIQLDAPQAKDGPGRSRRGSKDGIIVRHVDDDMIVVEKPAGLTTVRHADEAASYGPRARKFLPATLVDLLPAVLKQQGHAVAGRLRAVHRIDKETSGLVVLARTQSAESQLGKQFRGHTIGRHYVALVRCDSNPRQDEERAIESHIVRDRGDGRRGSGALDDGQHAVTHVRVVETLGEFALVECQLETGRTHQVRIHLGENGMPLCGERVYDRPLHGQPMPDSSGAKRPLLHAAYLAVDHPSTGKRLEWRSGLPKDMKALLEKLRKSVRK